MIRSDRECKSHVVHSPPAALRVLVALALIAWPHGVSAEDQDSRALLNEIVTAMTKRQNALKSVYYKLEGHGTIPKGLISRVGSDFMQAGHGEEPPEDYAYPQTLIYAVDFVNNRLRRESRGEIYALRETPICHPTFKIDLFDGQRVQSFEPRRENTNAVYEPYEFEPELSLQKYGYIGLMLNYEEEALLLAHAKFPTTHSTPGRFERLRLPLDDTMLAWHGHGKLKERDCLVLRTPAIGGPQETFYEYWVDAGRKDEVVLYRRLIDDHEHIRLEIEYRDTPVGRWLAGFTLDVWDAPGVRGQGGKMTVTEFEADPVLPQEEFHIEPTPGMIVYDAATDVRYRQGGPGEENIDVRILARNQPSRSRAWTWGIFAAIGIIALFAVLRARKRCLSAS